MRSPLFGPNHLLNLSKSDVQKMMAGHYIGHCLDVVFRILKLKLFSPTLDMDKVRRGLAFWIFRILDTVNVLNQVGVKLIFPFA
jgi:hypothetical protein